jgi:hypothetical protein
LAFEPSIDLEQKFILSESYDLIYRNRQIARIISGDVHEADTTDFHHGIRHIRRGAGYRMCGLGSRPAPQRADSPPGSAQ